MNLTVIATVLQTILSIIPQITDSKGINKVVAMLLQILPIIVREAQGLLPMAQNIIDAISSKDGVTADQLAALKALDAQIDAAFEAAVAAYSANHPAKPNPTQPAAAS
jgi:hypothetical protein